jgi:hypothetical protein
MLRKRVDQKGAQVSDRGTQSVLPVVPRAERGTFLKSGFFTDDYRQNGAETIAMYIGANFGRI